MKRAAARNQEEEIPVVGRDGTVWDLRRRSAFFIALLDPSLLLVWGRWYNGAFGPWSPAFNMDGVIVKNIVDGSREGGRDAGQIGWFGELGGRTRHLLWSLMESQ